MHILLFEQVLIIFCPIEGGKSLLNRTGSNLILFYASKLQPKQSRTFFFNLVWFRSDSLKQKERGSGREGERNLVSEHKQLWLQSF